MTFFRAPLLTRSGRIWVVLALIWAGGGIARAAEADPDVDGSMPEDYFPALKTMIGQALKQAPAIIIKEMDIEIAEAQKLSQGIAPLLPHVNGYLYGGEQNQAAANNPGGSNRSTGFYYDLWVGQPVFQWGQLKNGLLAQKVGVAINQRNYASVYLQFVQNMRGKYLGLVASKIQLRNARFTLDLRKKANLAVQERLKAGMVTAAYALGPSMEEERAQIDLETNEQNYAYSRRQFARMLGRTDFADGEVPATVPAPKFSSSAAAELTAEVLRTGARYTPDAQIGLLNVRNWELQYKMRKVNLLPRVSVTAEVNQQNIAQVQDGSVIQNAVTTQSYYLRADWNIFDGLATRGQKADALIHRRQAERDLKVKVDTTLDAAQNSQKLVELAWRSLDLATRQDGLSQANLHQAEDDLAAHVNSEANVESARSGAYDSEFRLAQARGAFMGQWADFVVLVGHDPAINNLPTRYVRPIQ